MISARLIRYCLVGGVGFLLDAGATMLLVRQGLSPFTARIFAIVFAVCCCAWLHRVFTFASVAQSFTTQLLRFFGSSLVGMGLNYLAYSGVLLLLGEEMLLPALVVGTAVGLVVNYGLSKRWVYSDN